MHAAPAPAVTQAHAHKALLSLCLALVLAVGAGGALGGCGTLRDIGDLTPAAWHYLRPGEWRPPAGAKAYYTIYDGKEVAR